MTTIALFGATGKTGRRVLDRALGAGYDGRALVRDPAKLSLSHPHLTVIRGDVLDAASVDETVAGADVVLALFGHVKGSPPDLQSRGVQHIVDAMKTHGARRIVTLSGGGLRDEANDRPKAADKVIRFLLKTLSGDVLADAERHLTVLQDSDVDWTVVRGPRLTEKPGTGSYRVGAVGVDASTQISRDDLADFVLTQVTDRRHIGRMPFVSN